MSLPPEFWLLCAGAALAGLVRGFSGFGTAMVYLPVAGQVLEPFAALTTLIVMDLLGPLPLVRRAWADAAPRDLARLGLAALVTMPLGLFTLSQVAPEAFRYAVSGITLVLVVLLIGGVRYRGAVTPPLVYATGGASGFLAGVAGLPGPPVILFYMAGSAAAASIRANTLLYLLLADLMILGLMAAGGVLAQGALLTGALLIPAYMAANIAGAALFRPGRERAYRAVAYVIIAGSALSGLPIWGGG